MGRNLNKSFASLEPRFYEVLRNILPPLLISLNAKLVRLILSKYGGNNTKCQLVYNQKSKLLTIKT